MLQIKNSGYILLIITLLVGIISCKDDDTAKNNRANILGTWEAIALTRTGCSNPDMNGADSINCTANNCIQYIFLKDTSGNQLFDYQITTEGQQTGKSGTYSVGDEVLTLCEDNEGEEICESLRVELSETIMTITENDEDTGCKTVTGFQKVSE